MDVDESRAVSVFSSRHQLTAVDDLGGASEISDTYVGAVLVITSTTALGAGAFVANDRSNSPSDGVFFDLVETFDATRLAVKP